MYSGLTLNYTSSDEDKLHDKWSWRRPLNCYSAAIWRWSELSERVCSCYCDFVVSLVQCRTVLPPVRRHRWDTARLNEAMISRQFVTPRTWTRLIQLPTSSSICDFTHLYRRRKPAFTHSFEIAGWRRDWEVHTRIFVSEYTKKLDHSAALDVDGRMILKSTVNKLW